jgi:hypothetical protein
MGVGFKCYARSMFIGSYGVTPYEEYRVAEGVRTTYIKALVFRVPEYASRRL